MKRYFDIKWIQVGSIIRIKRFLTSTNNGLLIVHIYDLDVLKINHTHIKGSPKNIGVYAQKCECCKMFWKSVLPFKTCNNCNDMICNKCIRRQMNIVVCGMCSKISCSKCVPHSYKNCRVCLERNTKETKFCPNCWQIISERNTYSCRQCNRHPTNPNKVEG